MPNDFDRIMATIMSEGLAKIEALTDEQIEKVVFDE